MDWRALWGRARLDFGLTDVEFWGLTWREYDALVTVWQEREAREDRRAQAVMWILAEINRDRKARLDPFTLEDFPIHRWSRLEAQPVPQRGPMDVAMTPEEAQAQVDALRSWTAMTFGAEAAVIHTKSTKKNKTKKKQRNG